MIIGIDPGTTKSGVAYLSTLDSSVLSGRVMENGDLLEHLRAIPWGGDVIACESVEAYGMAVGREVFETVRLIGRIEEIAAARDLHFALVTRREVKLHLCGSMRAKDANIRRALLDLYPATGGGKTPQVGTKKKPGPLFGFNTHAWAALAVAITYRERRQEREEIER